MNSKGKSKKMPDYTNEKRAMREIMKRAKEFICQIWFETIKFTDHRQWPSWYNTWWRRWIHNWIDTSNTWPNWRSPLRKKKLVYSRVLVALGDSLSKLNFKGMTEEEGIQNYLALVSKNKIAALSIVIFLTRLCYKIEKKVKKSFLYYFFTEKNNKSLQKELDKKEEFISIQGNLLNKYEFVKRLLKDKAIEDREKVGKNILKGIPKRIIGSLGIFENSYVVKTEIINTIFLKELVLGKRDSFGFKEEGWSMKRNLYDKYDFHFQTYIGSNDFFLALKL